ncbi:MAG: glucose-1-phosphate adenylyltransferase subunit GlgD [Oscillospiraceae bacterium]|nr:glucose-1-phosphate adenylyltransferase subunit GlgD [Oscillospiraceae bacterium]MDD4414135.1 glucose-1-phosphate adenylyltransferase subunit GlgD [Oscillospiraceae bacterium]
MRNNNVLGIVFSNMHDAVLPGITAVRPMGSVPFAGRYRLIDFTLSNLVNSGISKVGIITQNNYQSLMDHIGSGKSWDLSRKNEGLYFLPPFTMSDELYAGRIASLLDIRPFFRNAREEYVILSDCHVVGNIDINNIIKEHISSGADITVACRRGSAPPLKDNLIMWMNAENRIIDIVLGQCPASECDYGVGLYLMRKDIMMGLLVSASSRNQMNFDRDILLRHLDDVNIYGYRLPEYTSVISSLGSYFKTNMSLLNTDVRESLFDPQRPIYTKVRDAAPALYGLHASVGNSLIADGCFVEGTVHNSILFRDVHIARDAVVENSIVMQGTVISERTSLNYFVLDKNVVVKAGRALSGTEDFPMYINKGTVV